MARGGFALALVVALGSLGASGERMAQPDLTIVDRVEVGADLYNADGVGQQRSFLVTRQRGGMRLLDHRITVALANDGSAAARYRLRGSGAIDGFSVEYAVLRRHGRPRDVTDEVVGGELALRVRPGRRAQVVLSVSVAPLDDAPLGAVQPVTITARSAGDAELVDAVRMTFTNVCASG